MILQVYLEYEAIVLVLIPKGSSAQIMKYIFQTIVMILNAEVSVFWYVGPLGNRGPYRRSAANPIE